MSLALLIGIILILSIVQSVVGIGLLVFGTPTFLMLGLSFHETLGIVLPPSIIISLLQVIESRSIKTDFKRDFNIYCLVFVFIGLVFVFVNEAKFDFKYIVGWMLLVSGSLKLSSKLSYYLDKGIQRYKRVFLVLIGFVHGVSNMGGGLLSLYSSSNFKESKVKTRSAVAYGYLLMGIIQYITLSFYHPEVLKLQAVLLMVIALLTYIVLGRKLFAFTKDEIFQKILSTIILIYGILFLAKS